MMSSALFGPPPLQSFLSIQIVYLVIVNVSFIWAVPFLSGLGHDGFVYSNVNKNRNDDQCPVECACLGNVVDCSGLQLVSPPNRLPPWTERLELKDNNIKTWDFSADLEKLTELDISSNKLYDNFTTYLPNLNLARLTNLKVSKNLLTSIPDLSRFGNLTHVTLSHNLITHINGSLLQKMPHVTNLDLANNHIKDLKNGTFLAHNRILKLSLNSNELTYMDYRVFGNLTNLEELRLNRNHLRNIEVVAAIELKNLRLLDLNRNELTKIHPLNFQGLINIEEIRLKKNKIVELNPGAFWQLDTLRVLQIDYNFLTLIRNGMLFGLLGLRKLTLSHNLITAIDNEAWQWCRELEELDLSNNKLISMDGKTFEHLDTLLRLRLNNNKIAFISDGVFDTTPNLEILELSGNRLSSIIEDPVIGPFIILTKLIRLELSYNHVKSVNKNAFLGLKQLEELDLTGNNVTSIQENAFSSTVRLSKLKLNTVAMVCDCGLQWLSVWLRLHQFADAQVTCGYPHSLKSVPLTQLHAANFTCDEFPKPRIIEGPSSNITLMGDNITLMCQATSTSNTPLLFIWKHNNTELKHADVEISASGSESGITLATSLLHIKNATFHHGGRYQCVVTNTFGTTYSAKAKISVLVYPSFEKIPMDIQAAAGSTARLECSATGHPAPQIAWQKDGGNDFPAARERRMVMMPTDSVFFIVNVQAADSGVYSCTAQNLAGSIVKNATLTILEAPSFVRPMVDKNSIIGGSTVIECMASGCPRPQLTWRKDGQPLEITERHFFTANDQLLIIVNTEINDAGSYECEMNNSLGHSVGLSHLAVYLAAPKVVNNDEVLGRITISVVCCAVFTSTMWVIIIYFTRRHINAAQKLNGQVPITGSTSVPILVDRQTTKVYFDSSSQHSKDSGTGDSTNPSSDPLQLCLPEEIIACTAEDECVAASDDPLLHYTNHQRNSQSDDHNLP